MSIILFTLASMGSIDNPTKFDKNFIVIIRIFGILLGLTYDVGFLMRLF